MQATAALPPEAGRVLLIDDDDLIAGSLRGYLTRQGCDVDGAVDRAAAARLMGQRRYEVVLVDPFLTGGVRQASTAMVDDIALLQPQATIFVVTAYGSPELARRAGSASLSILSKPQSVTALTELIFGALRARTTFSNRGLN
jgi:DNA-binding NtrC family response regulator